MYFYLVLLLATLATVALSQTPSSATCGPCVLGECYQSQCACAAGAFGVDCSLSPPPTCSYLPLELLETKHISYMDLAQTGFSNNSLKMVVRSPLVQDRKYSHITFGSASGSGCVYPGARWVKSNEQSGDCEDIYTYQAPWTESLACGWTVDNSEVGYRSYKTNVYVTHQDQVSEFRGTPIYRDTVHVIPVSVRFKTSVLVSTDISVFSQFNLLAAVTTQVYDPVVTAGQVDITTSLQYPYLLEGPTLSDFPAGIGAVVTEDVSKRNCPITEGAPCLQVWTIAIDPQAQCTLSGNYTLDGSIACRAGVDCPLTANSNTAYSIPAKINSEDFCTEVDIDIGLAGSLQSYESNNFLQLRDDFLVNTDTFYSARLVSDDGVDLASSTLIDVKVEGLTAASAPLILLQNSITTSAGLLGNFQVLGSGSNFANFSFSANADVTNVPADEVADFRVTALVEVTYVGFANKREYRQIVARQAGGSGSSEAEVGAVVRIGGATGGDEDDELELSASHRSTLSLF